jgi:hypothetical protein
LISHKIISIGFPIDFISEFFQKCIKTVNDDLDDVEEKNEKGYYEDYGEYESAFSIPLKRQEIIYHATINELNILIDKTIRGFAFKYFKKEELKKRNDEFSIIKNIEDFFKLYNEHFDKLIKYINLEYEINISKINGYSQIIKIRNINNAYKHRENHKYKNTKINPKIPNVFDKYFIHDEDILKLINDTKQFLYDLYDLIKISNK